MKGSTLIAVILGFLSIFGAYLWEGGSFDTLFMLPAMLIVFGGTIAAATAGSSLKMMAKAPRLILLSFFPPHYNRIEIINQIVSFAAIARRQGILALEPMLGRSLHPFLKKLFQLSIDGTDPETLQKIAENEIFFITERHNANISFFTKMGGYSPTMGIIGTVMGLISTLANVGSDPNNLIHHIASAFIATMWGIFMANIVWLPIGDKLKIVHLDEMQIFQIILDGVQSVQLGETPFVIRAKLLGAFPLSQQEGMTKIHREKFKIMTPPPQPSENAEQTPQKPEQPTVVQQIENKPT